MVSEVSERVGETLVSITQNLESVVRNNVFFKLKKFGIVKTDRLGHSDFEFVSDLGFRA
mgnify:CR=1 FL=1